jgi:hypothetical protein
MDLEDVAGEHELHVGCSRLRDVLRDAREQAAQRPGAHVAHDPGLDHRVCLEVPDRVVPGVLEVEVADDDDHG